MRMKKFNRLRILSKVNKESKVSKLKEKEINKRRRSVSESAFTDHLCLYS